MQAPPPSRSHVPNTYPTTNTRAPPEANPTGSVRDGAHATKTEEHQSQRARARAHTRVHQYPRFGQCTGYTDARFLLLLSAVVSGQGFAWCAAYPTGGGLGGFFGVLHGGGVPRWGTPPLFHTTTGGKIQVRTKLMWTNLEALTPPNAMFNFKGAVRQNVGTGSSACPEPTKK